MARFVSAKEFDSQTSEQAPFAKELLPIKWLSLENMYAEKAIAEKD